MKVIAFVTKWIVRQLSKEPVSMLFIKAARLKTIGFDVSETTVVRQRKFFRFTQQSATETTAPK